MAKPLVAIVGRPNVGKSMLFNKLTGHRTSIVEDTPGVTRDRIYGDCEWCNRTFSLVDTGGIEPNTENDMLKFMRRQAEIGIELADCIVMVTDVRSGVTAADQDVATMLRKSGKPVALAVNKCDSVGPVNPDVYEFYSLGIGDLFEVSAVHGHGTGDLLDWCLENMPAEEAEDEEDETIKVAIVGKPLFPMWQARPGMPSTLILKMRPVNTALLILPVCGVRAKWTILLKSIPICVPSMPLSALMYA